MSKIEDILSEAVQEFIDKQNKLTKEQFFDCFNEAIVSGDFLIECRPVKSTYFESPHNTMDGKATFNLFGAQKMTYTPYREMQSLKSQLAERDAKIEKLVDTLIFIQDEMTHEACYYTFDINKQVRQTLKEIKETK